MYHRDESQSDKKMIIASPSMSTNAVIMRTVSFPFMVYSRVTNAVATSPTVARDLADILSMVSCGVWCGG